MTIDLDLIEQFKQWVFSELSMDTAQSYSHTLKQFCHGRDHKEVNDPRFFVELSNSFQEKHAELGTISRHVYAVKKFLRYLETFHRIEIFDIDKVRCKRPKEKDVNFLEREEVSKIRDLPIKTVGNLRDRVLFEFYLYTGCRASEGVAIDWTDISFEKGEVMVIGKGNLSRTVFIGESAPWIKKYLLERGRDDRPLFLNQYGGRLHRKAVFRAIRNLGKAAGLNRPIYPHMLRATFCTYLILNGTDPKTVQKLMGHKDLETTLRYYFAVTKDHMKEAHEGLGKYIEAGFRVTA